VLVTKTPKILLSVGVILSQNTFHLVITALHKMWAIATDAVASFVCLSVCLLLVTFVSPAKTAEPIQVPFGG